MGRVQDRDPGLRLACRLEVRSRGGRTHIDETRYRRGGAEDPVSVGDLEDKFMTLTSAALSAERAKSWLDHIRTIEEQPRVMLP